MARDELHVLSNGTLGVVTVNDDGTVAGLVPHAHTGLLTAEAFAAAVEAVVPEVAPEPAPVVETPPAKHRRSRKH